MRVWNKNIDNNKIKRFNIFGTVFSSHLQYRNWFDKRQGHVERVKILLPVDMSGVGNSGVVPPVPASAVHRPATAAEH